jgi:hypothetical protein
MKKSPPALYLLHGTVTLCVRLSNPAAGFSSFDFLARRSFEIFLAARVVIFQ